MISFETLNLEEKVMYDKITMWIHLMTNLYVAQSAFGSMIEGHANAATVAHRSGTRVMNVTDMLMSYLFHYRTTFNEPRCWATRNVRDFSYMFVCGDARMMKMSIDM